MTDPNMPKIIPGVWVGLVAGALGVAAAFGLPVTPEQQTAIMGFSAALAAALPTIDAWLRRARLQYIGSQNIAKLEAIGRLGGER